MEKSVDEIFQELYEKRKQFGLGATGAPVRKFKGWWDEITGARDYDDFWKEIMEYNPGRPLHLWDDWEQL